MRRYILAILIAGLMLLVPISSVAQQKNVYNNHIVEDDVEELPSFYITEQQKIILNNFIENNFEGEEKTEAITVLNDIIENDLEINIAELANKLSLYIYVPIPQEELNEVTTHEDLDNLLSDYWGLTEGGFIENLFSQLLIKIIEMIQDRLGWIYTLFMDGTSLFYNGINLFVNVIKDKFLAIGILFVIIINDILAAPQAFISAIKELFQFEYDNFINIISQFLDQFSTDILTLLDEIKAFIINEDILNYLDEIEGFVTWLDDDPWEAPIKITGTVTSFKGIPQDDIIVSCKGQTGETNNNGEFEFYVDSSPDSESIPAGEYYGMHNCQITISDDEGVIKSTIKLLSYCFSGGKITWSFFIRTAKSKNINRTPMIKLLQEFLIKIVKLFPKISDIIDNKIITQYP